MNDSSYLSVTICHFVYCFPNSYTNTLVETLKYYSLLQSLVVIS